MALKPCNECNKEISTDAKACPKCGKKAPHRKKGALPGWVVFLCLSTAVISLLGTVSRGSNDGTESKSARKGDNVLTNASYSESICYELIKEMAKYPSSVEDVNDDFYPDHKGNAKVVVDFTALNAIGGRLPHRGECHFYKNGSSKVNIYNR